MFESEIDYKRTIELKKIVLNGLKVQKICGSFFFSIPLLIILYVWSQLFPMNLQANLIKLDNFRSISVPLLVLVFLMYIYIKFFTKDRLKEIRINSDEENAKEKLFQAATNLGWHPSKIDENYLLFVTNLSSLKDSQNIALVFFPDGRVYFNSLSRGENYFQFPKFRANYRNLIKEYYKIEREQKTVTT